jgi:vacuolar-type H+-ATPase subunit E/Vma4
MTTNEEATDKLCEEILADARMESEKIIFRAKQDAEAFLTNAAAEADHLRRERLDQARAEATRRRTLILAQVPVEANRTRAARIEALLESVYEEARKRLLAREGFEYREAVIDLASHAIQQMAGAVFVIKLSDTEKSLIGDNLADEIARRVGRPVRISLSYEQDSAGGGVVVQDAETHQLWDNRFLKKLDRLWPELRRQIALQATFVAEMESKGDSL